MKGVLHVCISSTGKAAFRPCVLDCGTNSDEKQLSSGGTQFVSEQEKAQDDTPTQLEERDAKCPLAVPPGIRT